MSTRRTHLVRADELKTGDIIDLRGTHYHAFGLRYHIVWSAVKKIDDEGGIHFDAVVYDHEKLQRNREYFGWPVHLCGWEMIRVCLQPPAHQMRNWDS